MEKRRKPVQEEEDAATLHLGKEIAQERMLMEKGEQGISSIFKKTMDYSTHFSKFLNKQTVDNVRGLFPLGEFEPYEAAQLANLCCETAEEAKALIPSLSRHQDDHLQNLLNEMANLLKFQ